MGILSRKLGVQAMSLEDPSQPLLPPSALFESVGLGRSDAGILVNEKRALGLTTAFACIKVISEDLASTGHEIHQRMPDGSIRPATNHRLWPLLHDAPNNHMTAMVFWGALLASALGWGNAYAWIKYDNAGRVIALVLLASGRTTPVNVHGKLMYVTTQTDSGKELYLEPEEVLHIPGLTMDGVKGLSPVQTCKNAYGLALAAEKFGAQFFGNGARATGVLSHPEVLDEEARENLKKSIREMASGDSALRPIVLEEGMKWEQITINPNDAQFLATRQFQRVEVASMYRVPMHLLQDLQKATNNNIEHQSLDYIRYCLRPWAVRIEQEVNKKLLSGPFFMEHNLNDMQRGDFASQTTGFQTLRNIGVYSANDILRAMRQNPIPASDGGDIRTVQGAMIPLSSLLSKEGSLDEPQTDSDEGASQPFDRLAPAFRSLMRDAVGRTINRQQRDGDFIARTFRPIVISVAQASFAMRFANVELTETDRRKVNELLVDIVSAAPSWQRKEASAIADRLTLTVQSKFF